MASLVERNKRYYVVYTYEDEKGEKKQKWEGFTARADAVRRKSEVEYRKEVGSVVIPQCETMNELLKEYIAMYGKSNWSLSTYSANVNMIKSYIQPYLGAMKLEDITARVLEKYYQSMLRTQAVPKCTDKKYKKEVSFVSTETVRRIHKLLHCCFEQAVRWDLMIRNPAQYATVPKSTRKQRDIWTAETLMKAVELCDDPKLKLAINLAFACSLRIGELLGLTWSCIDISEATSVRKVFLPRTVAEMLVDWKKDQDELREALGPEYVDYDLVFTGYYGMPTEASSITASFQKLIKENNLPKVVFHSLRHSSITYKLKLNGGDIKAVQGDSGHAQAKMVTDQYSHILDDDRKLNAQLFENAFYQKKEVMQPVEDSGATESGNQSSVSADDRRLLEKLMSDESTAALLMALVKKLT